jgi:glutamine amidotransferase
MQDGIVVIDYDMGNLKSITNAFKALDVAVTVSADPDVVARARAIVLPGVGAFADGMRNLRRLGLLPILRRRVIEEGVPYLGICLGMQFLADVSEEHGETEGLGWIGGRVLRIRPRYGTFKVPHMGWNELELRRSDARLFRGVPQGAAFYFLHSYHFVPRPDAADCVTAVSDHGGEVVAAVERDNVFGVQFHPEKSQGAGLILLRNFMDAVAARA